MDVQPALRDALPRLIRAEQELRRRAIGLGIAYRIAPFGGIRTPADTAKLLGWRDEAVARGEPYYRVASADGSKHNVGAAFDIEIVSTRHGMTKSAALNALGFVAPSVGLIWGGTFSHPADPVHFELPGTIADLRREYSAPMQSGTATPSRRPSSVTSMAPILIAMGAGIVLVRLFRSA